MLGGKEIGFHHERTRTSNVGGRESKNELQIDVFPSLNVILITDAEPKKQRKNGEQNPDKKMFPIWMNIVFTLPFLCCAAFCKSFELRASAGYVNIANYRKFAK